jgi:hypothetical protein
VVVRVEERCDGWWVLIEGGPDDLLVPEMRECGPAPSEALARAHVVDITPLLADMLGIPLHKLLVGNPGRN